MIRALFRSVAMPGGTALHCKIYYPAVYSATAAENNTGLLPAVAAPKPYPVAILMPGINVGPEGYGWLAHALAQAGFVCVLYGWIVEEMAGMIALSCGLEVDALRPEHYGRRPSATALPPLLTELAALNRSGTLAGRLDLKRLLLGGHSAGGSAALMNARADWVPGLRAAFAYGSHSKASTMLGYAADTYLPLPVGLPKLVLGGGEDGVIAASAFRYGGDAAQRDATGPLRRTFEEAVGDARDDCHLAVVRGANHFSFCHPQDGATGRPFLDWPTTRDDAQIRDDLARLVCTFGRAYVADDASALTHLRELLADGARVQDTATR